MPERDRRVESIADDRDCGNGGMAVNSGRRAACQQRALQAWRIGDRRLQPRVLAGMQKTAQVLQRVHLHLLLHAEQQQCKEQRDERAVSGGDQVIDTK